MTELKNWQKSVSGFRFEKREIREALEPWRTIEIQTDRGIPAGPYLYQMRQDGENKWIFLAHAQKPQNPDSVLEERLRICVPGCWKAFSYDALTGKKQEVPVSYKNGKTLWSEVSYAQVLLILSAAWNIRFYKDRENGWGIASDPDA